MHELKVLIREKYLIALQVFVGLLLLFQFSGFVSVFSEHIDPRSIISSRDADAAHVVGTANNTRWYKDNGESAYGALYYRIAHTFGALDAREFSNSDSANENSERAHHLILMVMSLLCVYGIAYLLASLLWVELLPRLVFTFAMTGLFLSNSTWATFVFRAHPDMLFGFMVLAAFLATARALENPKSSLWFKTSALLWGLAGMVKLTFVLFLPLMWVLWLPPFTKQNARTALRYYLWMLPGYLFVGFPQSFNFPRSIKFLIYQSQFGLPATNESLARWFSDLENQMLWPLIAVTILALFSKVAPQSKGKTRLLIFLLFPLLMILGQNSDYRNDYYLIPMVGVSLAWVAFSLRGRIGALAAAEPKIRFAPLALLICAVAAATGFIPKTMEEELQKTVGCRKEALQISRAIHTHIDLGRVFVLDPYVAFDRKRAGAKANSGWANTWTRVQDIKATAFALNAGYAASIMKGDEPTRGIQVDIPNWREARSFYQSFLGKAETQGPDGATWKKAEAMCGWEIWLKQ